MLKSLTTARGKRLAGCAKEWKSSRSFWSSAVQRHGDVLTKSENDLAQANRQHLSEVEAALGKSMVVAAERQEHLVLQSEQLLKEMQIALVEAAGTSLRQQEELVRTRRRAAEGRERDGPNQKAGSRAQPQSVRRRARLQF